jgi:hypothetical protein
MVSSSWIVLVMLVSGKGETRRAPVQTFAAAKRMDAFLKAAAESPRAGAGHTA